MVFYEIIYCLFLAGMKEQVLWSKVLWTCRARLPSHLGWQVVGEVISNGLSRMVEEVMSCKKRNTYKKEIIDKKGDRFVRRMNS